MCGCPLEWWHPTLAGFSAVAEPQFTWKNAEHLPSHPSDFCSGGGCRCGLHCLFSREWCSGGGFCSVLFWSVLRGRQRSVLRGCGFGLQSPASDQACAASGRTIEQACFGQEERVHSRADQAPSPPIVHQQHFGSGLRPTSDGD